VNLNAAGIFNFDTTSGELVLDVTISITLSFGPFKVIGSMRRSSVCIDAGTVISGSLQVDAGAFVVEGVTVVLTRYCKDDQMVIVDLTGSMTELKIMDGVVIKDMSMSLVGVRKKQGSSAELGDLDWTGKISGTLATDGSVKIPGAVGTPELAITTTMSLTKGVFDWKVRAKGTAQLALGVGITGAVTLDMVIPCKTGDSIQISGSLWMKLGRGGG